MYNIQLAALLICIACFVNLSYSQQRKTNCLTGSRCDQCAEGKYKTLTVGGRNLKVCCPGCSKYLRAGYRKSDNAPWCQCDNVRSISGDCWKGEQCEQCLAGPNKGYVGFINSIPVCCANCERSGKAFGVRRCNCLHNGP